VRVAGRKVVSIGVAIKQWVSYHGISINVAMDLAAFARLISTLSEERQVRDIPPDHPRLQIMGPLEARLLHADFVILGGLNEGVWPSIKRAEPFFSQAMRTALAMPPLERRIGLSAHDFAQLMGAPRVLMTRAKRVDGAPSVASRWLWRLKTLARGALGEDGADAALRRKGNRSRPEAAIFSPPL